MRISVTGGGSGTGIAAMINGTVDIANASRAMKAEEIDGCPGEWHHRRSSLSSPAMPSPSSSIPPTRSTQLTLQQISDIYTRKITNWSEVGGEDRPIVLLSRESNSGTYVYFLENVVRQGDKKSELLFSPDTLLMPSSEGISAEVRQNPNAIGYDGLGYVTPDQKVLRRGPRCRWPLRAAFGRHGQRWHLSDLAPAVHVHRRRAGGRDQGLSGLGADAKGRIW